MYESSICKPLFIGIVHDSSVCVVKNLCRASFHLQEREKIEHVRTVNHDDWPYGLLSHETRPLTYFSE